ncbi:MAG: cytochrome c oxidase subunit 3 family protein [Bdellovibrionales bacterium]|nr:cytochrome c oxidase subunit 3 family protein [Bdellovibrionales bacterium]
MSHSSSDVISHEGPPHVHHMDPVTAYQSAKLGMWLFLATEILLFGGLFAAFALFRWKYLAEFHHASLELNRVLGAVNTVVLIVSSFSAALAVDSAQKGRNKKVCTYIYITLACALAFLVIKGFEYSAKIHHGLFPGTVNHETGVAFNDPVFNEAYRCFFGLYYCMTGLHALHVIFGMGILIWALLKAKKNRFSATYYTPMEMGALYWHLVDLIWIYLFPLLYLVG